MPQGYNPAFDPMSPQFAMPGDGGDVSMLDRGKALVQGVAETGATIASGARATADATDSPNADALADFFRTAFKDTATAAGDSMSSDARAQLQASVLSPEFWQHPVSASVLKGLNMSPSVAAAVVPAVLFPEGVLAQAGVAAAGGALGAGQSASDVYDQTDSMSDEELQKAMPYYAGLRSMGVPEDAARGQANTKLMGLKPLLNAAAGAAAMSLGPAGRLAGLAPEAAGAGLLKRVGTGAAEGMLGGAMMGAAAETTHQQTQIDLDQRTQMDPALILAATADSAITQGVMGGLGGTVTGHAGEPRAPAPKPVDGIDEAQKLALSAKQPAAAALPEEAKTPPAPVSPTPDLAATGAPTSPPSGEIGQNLTKIGQNLPKIADDAGKTVPESGPTLQAQQQQLVDQQRRAMLFPKGSGRPLPIPEGMKTIVTRDGVFHYNPKLITAKEIYDAAKSKSLNTVLDLGNYSKADLAPKIAAGEAPVAVTERAPDGTEVKAAAGTTGTAADQVKSLEASKTPGNQVAVESPESVLAKRIAAAKATAEGLRQKETPQPAVAVKPKVEPVPRVAPKPNRVVKTKAIHVPDKALNELSGQKMAEISAHLENIWRTAEEQEKAGRPIKGGIEAFIARKREEMIAQAKTEAGIGEKKPAAPRARAQDLNEGKHYTKEQQAARSKNNETASAVIQQFEPHPDENAPGGRDLVLERAKMMVEVAEKEGVSVPTKIRDAKDKSMEHNHAVTLLAEAKALAKKHTPLTEDFARFIGRERLLRTGDAKDREQVLADRRAEGDAEMQRRSKGASLENIASPEAEVQAERERLENVAEEGAGDASAEEESDSEAENQTAPKGEERAEVALKGDEVVIGKDRAGTFKVETKKTRSRVMPAVKNKMEAEFGGDDLHETSLATQAHIQKSLEGRSVHDVARFIAANADRPTDREIAKRVSVALAKQAAAGVKFDFKVAHPGDMVPVGLNTSHGMSTAHFPVNERNPHIQVWVNGIEHGKNSGLTYQTLLHELVHAVTQTTLHLGSKGGNVGTEAHQLVTDLNRLRINAVMAIKARLAGPELGISKFDQEASSGRVNALQNAHELLAWGMTNPRMQEFLESVPYKSENIFSAFVGTIRRLLRLPDKSQTALTEVIRIGDRLLDFNAENISRLKKNAEMGTQVEPMITHMKAGDFTPAGNMAHTTAVESLFRDPFTDSLGRAGARTKESATDFMKTITSPAKTYAATIEGAKSVGGVMSKALNAVTTNDQYRQKVEKLLPMTKQVFDAVEKTGVLANKLKEDGLDLTGALMRAQKSNPKLFEEFASLVHEQTMVGADASAELGQGRNSHLQLSKELAAKLAKGEKIEDIAHDAAMNSWEARAAHPALQRRYKSLIDQNHEFGPLQRQLFDYYEKSQSAIAKDQIDNILRTYDFKGSDAQRAAMVDQIHSGNFTAEGRQALEDQLGKSAVKLIEDTEGLKVVRGPYAPLMRRGEHAVIGEYKVPEPGNGKKIGDDLYEFKSKKDAHAFASKTGLHTEIKSKYYDTATGEPVKAKADAVSTVGEPEQRFQVRVQRNHLEFHERAADAKEAYEAHKASGLFEKVGLEERRHIESEESQFSGRGVESLLRSLANQQKYKDASELERATMRHTIREAGLRAMSDNRVQARRLPRRFVQGASDDVARNLYEYNTSQANYRAKMKFRQEIDDGLKGMWDHVKASRYSDDNQSRSAAANEVERRVRSPDPNEYSGAYTDWTRRLSTWSYIDRMARPSHLILHQTHLPMITAPYMAGRHGLMNSFGSVLKAWKELTGAYSAGGHDAWAATVGSALQKGTDYTELAKAATKSAPDGKRVGQMFDRLAEIGLIHPQAGIEVTKYLPSKQLSGVVGGLDRGLNKVDTVFRQLTNATEAINRHAGAMAAYRMEFTKLTRAGKSEAAAHEGAIEYARQTLSDTQGLFSSTNASPLFKNKFLKPFLQFKQFPQMMYHLLSKLAVTALKGETREAKVQALASLGAILGMHMMMAGVLQGLPLEPFKLLGLISKGIGLTDGDWTDVEQAVTRSINANFGKDVGEVLTRGLGAQLGVDVHHRLGLNSFVTYGMPDQLDSKSVSEFIMNAVAGAPGGMVTDALKGTHKMMTGDIEGGALQAFPLQAFRDIHNAVAPAPNKYGYEATDADRVKSLMGFTPAAKAEAAEKKEAVYNAVQEYDQRRSGLIKSWVSAPSGDRERMWSKIQAWNAGVPTTSRLSKGDLYKALSRAASGAQTNRTVENVSVNNYSKAVAKRAADLYQ